MRNTLVKQTALPSFGALFNKESSTMFQRFRYFSKEYFDYYDDYYEKEEAIKTAKQLRQEGYKCRIVSSTYKESWAVYFSKKQ